LRILVTTLLCGLLLAMMGCGPSGTIKHDFDATNDFSQYSSYGWYDGQQLNDALSQNPLVKKRVQASTDKVLQAKGFQLIEGGNPSFVMVVHAGVQEKMQITSSGGMYGWYDPRFGPYGAGTQSDVYYYDEGTLIFDIIDVAKKELVWRGMATSTLQDLSAEKQQQFFDDIAHQVLDSFPPR